MDRLKPDLLEKVGIHACDCDELQLDWVEACKVKPCAAIQHDRTIPALFREDWNACG